jgi:hypothetical protein
VREAGLVFPPTGRGRFVIAGRLRAALRAAQDALGVPHLTWYQSTRHTFASHWVTKWPIYRKAATHPRAQHRAGHGALRPSRA